MRNGVFLVPGAGRRAVCALSAVLLCVLFLFPAAHAAGESEAVLGTSTRSMSPKQTSQSYGARLQETALGNLVADGMRAQSGAQIAIACGGNLVKALGGGEITREDVQAVFAADERIGVVEMTADCLFDVLEEAVGQVRIDEREWLDADSGFDGFPQISGFSFTYDASQLAGNRVRTVRLDDGTALSRDAERLLTVALPESMTEGTLGFSMLRELPVRYSGTQAQALADHISALGEVTPPKTGRITVLGTTERTIYSALHVGSFLPYLIILILLIRLPGQRGRERNMDGTLSKRYRKTLKS